MNEIVGKIELAPKITIGVIRESLRVLDDEDLINEMMRRYPKGCIIACVKRLTKRQKKLIIEFTEEVEYSKMDMLAKEVREEIEDHYGSEEEEWKDDD